MGGCGIESSKLPLKLFLFESADDSSVGLPPLNDCLRFEFVADERGANV
jgi:hypothetical protein